MELVMEAQWCLCYDSNPSASIISEIWNIEINMKKWNLSICKYETNRELITVKFSSNLRVLMTER